MLKGMAIRVTVGTDNILLLHANPDRKNLYLEADRANTGNIFINWGDAAQANTGDKRGIQLSAGESVFDIDPCNQDMMWVIASATGQTLIFREDTEQDHFNETCDCALCKFQREKRWSLSD